MLPTFSFGCVGTSEEEEEFFEAAPEGDPAGAAIALAAKVASEAS